MCRNFPCPDTSSQGSSPPQVQLPLPQLAAQKGHLVARKRAFAAGPRGPGPPPGPASVQAGTAAGPTAHPTRCCHRCRGAASLPVLTPSKRCPPNAPPPLHPPCHARPPGTGMGAGRGCGKGYELKHPLQLGSSKWRGQGSGSGIRGQGQGWMTACIEERGGPHSGGEGQCSVLTAHIPLQPHALNPKRAILLPANVHLQQAP